MIEPAHPKLSIARQCELIHLSRASYYRVIGTSLVNETSENLELMRLIDEEYTKHPFYGSRQLCNYLRRKGHLINRKRIQRLMRLLSIRSVAPKPSKIPPYFNEKKGSNLLIKN